MFSLFHNIFVSVYMSYLYNKEQHILEQIDDTQTIDKIYFQEYKLPSISELKEYNTKKTHEQINKLVSDMGHQSFIASVKMYISKLEFRVPLYDIYTENLYIIHNVNIYTRVMYNHYRFPDKSFIKSIESLLKESKTSIETQDELYIRKLRKAQLILDFMSNFDIDILENTYYSVMYKYSIELGKNIVFCKRPSFNKYILSSKPYYTRSEIINMAMNMNITIPDRYLNRDYITNLCEIVRKNDVSYDVLLDHQKHIIDNDSLGIIQYYTIQGSYFINTYLRNFAPYKTQNVVLNDIIKKMWKLCITAPAFDKSYILYRFINDDKYLTKYKVGDIFEEQGFMSTTRDPFYRSDLYQFGFILIKVKIPSNTRGVALCLETLSHFPEEQEIIFPPKSKFKLVNKNDKCQYYHTDDNFSSKVKTRYEFEWVSNTEHITINKPESREEIKNVNFLTERAREFASVQERIKFFTSENINSMSQFSTTVGNKSLINIVERYDSTGAYKNFYALKNMRDGFSIYSVYNGYLLYFIELGETENGNEMHVNYYVKYNTLDKDSILNDVDLLTLVSSIAYYFGINNVAIYAEYKACTTTQPHITSLKTRELGQRGFQNEISKEIATHQEKNIHTNLTGNYCSDYYDYLKRGKKRFLEKNISTTELKPKFSYFDLDNLKNIKPDSVLTKDDRDEIYQVFEKVFKQTHKKSSLADFIIWIIENKCYLIDHLIPKLTRVYGEINPFENDLYILDPITYLYNRRLIMTYTAIIQDDIFEPRQVYIVQKNEYRTSSTRTRQHITL